MKTTSLSLLERVRNPMDGEAWMRLVDLYAPFLHLWGRRAGLSDTDASDLTQEVLTVLAQKLPTFEYDASKSFRSWLKTITLNRAKNFHRAAVNRPTIGVDSAIGREATYVSEADLFEESEYCAFVTQRILELVKHEFREQDWRAFQLQFLEERPTGEVAAELGISVNSVYLAKSRVLRRLREEAAALLD